MRRKFILIIIISIFPFMGFSCGKEESTDAGVFRSSDNGDTWEQKVKIDDKNDISKVSILEIEVDSKDNNFLLSGTEGLGLYRSTDGGDTWVATALSFGNINSIAINPEDNAIIYASGSFNTIGKIYKSTDAGNNWEEVFSESSNDTPVNSIEMDWYDPRIVYAATTSGALIKSKDSGRSWVAIKRFDDPVNKVALGSKDSRVIYLYTEDELFKSTDSGKTFTNISKGFEEYKFSEFHDLAIHPKFSNILYISSDFGLLVSENGGKNWKEVNTLAKPSSRMNSHIALEQLNPNIIYFGFGSNLYISEDNGVNWAVKQFTTGNIGDINSQASQDSIIYVGVIAL